MKHRLTEGQEEQLKKMAEKGDRPKEIKEYFRRTYGIDLQYNKISYIRKTLGLVKKQRGRPAKEKVNDKPTSISDMAKEIMETVEKTDQMFKDVFMQLRLRLIKSYNEVYKMKQALEGKG